ncbi:dnaJ homolog subfamily C member 7-like [Artemia franciscana]|uniref:J domain-containing protein n=1 Tax=Artemia franciscana TaxID=6661 RepID=A0AA88IH91_ARTSF|nr:hypothetical protein QYM36_004522 [Artemia franciscana]
METRSEKDDNRQDLNGLERSGKSPKSETNFNAHQVDEPNESIYRERRHRSPCRKFGYRRNVRRTNNFRKNEVYRQRSSIHSLKGVYNRKVCTPRHSYRGQCRREQLVDASKDYEHKNKLRKKRARDYNENNNKEKRIHQNDNQGEPRVKKRRMEYSEEFDNKKCFDRSNYDHRNCSDLKPNDAYATISDELAEDQKDKGNKYYKQKDYRRALGCYAKAVELCPCAPYYGNRAACYIMLGMYSQALQDARESIKCEPSYAKGHFRMGKCSLAMGDVATAKSAFDKAKELEPTNTTIDTELRTIDTLNKIDEDLSRAVEIQDYLKALYCSERALDIAVFCQRYKVKKAESLTHLGRYQEAEEIVNDILRSDSTDVDSLLVRGMCLYYQDNIDLAFSHFQQVLRLAPDYGKAKETYKKAKQLMTKKEEGNVAFKQGKLKEALTIYTETLAIDPVNKLTNSKVYYNRALVNSKLGNHSLAVDDCSAALNLNDGYIKALLLRGKSYRSLGKYEECVRDYEACMKLERNANRETRRLLQEAKIEMKRSKQKDYYKILGVEKNANDDEIKKAYRKRALLHHPDRHSSATEEERKEHEKNFKDLGEAYTVLSDPKNKAQYDRGQDLDDEGWVEVDPQMFSTFFGSGPSPFSEFHFEVVN